MDGFARLATLCGLLLVGCASGGGADPARTTQGASLEAPSPDGGGSTDSRGGIDVTLGNPGSPCPTDGAHACWRHGSKLAVVCTAGVWEVSTICDDDQRCDSAAGPTQGKCLPVAGECQGHEAEHGFCDGDTLRTCLDLVSFTDRPCGAGATCSAAGAPAACTCKAGYEGMPGGCSDVDECANGGGGCDQSAPCHNTEGSYTCGTCPPGYIGGAGGKCTPSLTDLMATPVALAPGFDPTQTKYELTLPITATAITLTPSAPPEAAITIGDQRVQTGQPWRSPMVALGDSTITMVVSEASHPQRRYSIRVHRGQSKDAAILIAANAEASDAFGTSLAISGDTLVVGAPSEDSNAKGIDGAADNNAASASGAAYVFVRGRDGWTQQAYLKASNTAAGALFGAIVAIAGDTVAVGAPGEATNPADMTNTAYGSGAVYVFTRRKNKWSQEAMLKAGNAGAGDYFGTALALSDDTLVAGAPGEASNATGIDGRGDNNSAFGSGAVYVFSRAGKGWTQDAYIKPEVGGAADSFGCTMALAGDTLVVGATGEDSAGKGINRDGDPQNNAAENSGAAYTFVRDGKSWSQEAYIKGSNTAAGDSFGYSVSIVGNTLAVGAPGTAQGNGAVYIFERSGGMWSQLDWHSPMVAPMAVLSGPGDAFGASVRLIDDVLLIGAYGQDSDGGGFNGSLDNARAPNSGAVYMFSRSGDSWFEADHVKAPSSRANQQFGSRMALSSDTIVVGAMNDGQAVRGSGSVPAGQAKLGPPGSGAVYVFR